MNPIQLQQYPVRVRPIFYSILLSICLVSVTSAQTATKPIDVGPPQDSEFASLAAKLEQQGRDFDQIFAALCRHALENSHSPDSRPLKDQIRSVFGGMWIWTHKGGRPAIQARQDWAMHFIGGGAFEGYWDVGTTAALIKERSDARDPSNRYDLNDLAATMLGARWMRVAVDGSSEQTRDWVARWAEKKLVLSHALPALQFGRMPAGQEASTNAVQEIWRVVEAALPMPKPVSATQ